ncbi:hypothetical protein [Proteiniborus sp. MB09-C3]|uniref:hypothetical protein n=1 Tax=Proteiniborus sp. MB09-C3 TaxID=3050072 RepID=UPI002552F73F|nr:hypothetical protein [Proteiniborus sp. MB09-C3]WIV12443.1 hypothetical protein QO263_01575 [Proteiniborus sp. MB09-C3]
MDSLKRAIKFQNIDAKKSVISFWAVILIVNIVFYFINLYGSSNSYLGFNANVGVSREINGVIEISVVGSNLMAIAVYFIAYSYLIYYETFPIAISFSVTRKDFFKSIIANSLPVVFLFSLIQGVLMKIDPILVKAIDRNPMLEFTMFNVNTDNIIFIVFSLFICYLTFASAMNMLAALNYKFGYKIWIVFGIVFSFFMFSRKGNIIGNTIVDFLGRILSARIDLPRLLTFSIIIVICYALGYFLTINTSIRGKAA